jgi:hypothetical protein
MQEEVGAYVNDDDDDDDDELLMIIYCLPSLQV